MHMKTSSLVGLPSTHGHIIPPKTRMRGRAGKMPDEIDQEKTIDRMLERINVIQALEVERP